MLQWFVLRTLSTPDKKLWKVMCRPLATPEMAESWLSYFEQEESDKAHRFMLVCRDGSQAVKEQLEKGWVTADQLASDREMKALSHTLQSVRGEVASLEGGGGPLSLRWFAMRVYSETNRRLVWEEFDGPFVTPEAAEESMKALVAQGLCGKGKLFMVCRDMEGQVNQGLLSGVAKQQRESAMLKAYFSVY